MGTSSLVIYLCVFVWEDHGTSRDCHEKLSGKLLQNEMEGHHAINGQTDDDWPFSIAISVITRQ